ncbi:hypothetical protein DsansV1_C13g0121211 [Dioscorea sansibarensis]
MRKDERERERERGRRTRFHSVREEGCERTLMAFEIPTVVIRDLQIRLREHACIQSYDSPMPALPSITDAVAGFDPSFPPHLRCTRCHAGLLRGHLSTICVFCGSEQWRDGTPLIISFNSTVACRNLLDSLGLDGSETVTLEPEMNESSKKRDAPKDELVLSDLLNLELKWPLDPKVVDDDSTKLASSQSMPVMNLSGVDLDNFFTVKETASNAPGSSNEPFLAEKQTANPESDRFSGSENLGFSASLHSSGATKSSVDTKGDQFEESFADWDADFQSAGSESFATDTKTVDYFKFSLSVKDFDAERMAEYPNLNEHIELERNGEVSSGESIKGGGELSLNDSGADNFWSNLKTEVSNASGQSKSTSLNDNVALKNQTNHKISISDNGTLDNPWPASSNNNFNNTRGMDDSNDLFDDWQDFTSSGVQLDVSSSPVQTDIKMSTEERSLQTDSANLQDMDFGDFFVSNGSSETPVVHNSAGKELSNTKGLKENSDIFYEWQGLRHLGKASTDIPNVQTQTGSGTTTYDLSLETKLKGVQDIYFGDFMFSDSTSRLQDSQGPSSSRKELDVNSLNNNDLFDSWQDFTSFGAAPAGSLNSQSLAGVGTSLNEDSPEMSSTNLQNTELGGHLHPKVLPAMETSQKVSDETNNMQPIASAFHRMNASQEKIDRDSTTPGVLNTDDSFSSASQQDHAEATVEMLLSRMPDLSFMLSSDLSIPKTTNSSSSNSSS